MCDTTRQLTTCPVAVSHRCINAMMPERTTPHRKINKYSSSTVEGNVQSCANPSCLCIKGCPNPALHPPPPSNIRPISQYSVPGIQQDIKIKRRTSNESISIGLTQKTKQAVRAYIPVALHTAVTSTNSISSSYRAVRTSRNTPPRLAYNIGHLQVL